MSEFRAQISIRESIYKIILVGSNDFIKCIICGECEIIDFNLGQDTNRYGGYKKPPKGNKKKKEVIRKFEEKHLAKCRGIKKEKRKR